MPDQRTAGAATQGNLIKSCIIPSTKINAKVNVFHADFRNVNNFDAFICFSRNFGIGNWEEINGKLINN